MLHVFASWFLSLFQFIEAQLEYHKKAAAVLDNVLPTLKQLWGKLGIFVLNFLSLRCLQLFSKYIQIMIMVITGDVKIVFRLDPVV